MDKEVVLTILGAHRDEDADNGSVETVAEGEYFLRGGAHYVLFEEDSDHENLKSRIKIKGKTVELVRQGSIGTHMIFEENKKHVTSYQTSYGQMCLGINTGLVRIEEGEESIRAVVEYVLEADEQYLSHSRIEILIQNKKHRTE